MLASSRMGDQRSDSHGWRYWITGDRRGWRIAEEPAVWPWRAALRRASLASHIDWILDEIRYCRTVRIVDRAEQRHLKNLQVRRRQSQGPYLRHLRLVDAGARCICHQTHQEWL